MEVIKKNNVYTIEITDVTSEGNGVGKINDFVVFVPGTVTGDVAEVMIIKLQKSYAYGKVKNIITPSDKRQEPKCGVFSKCGGCSLMHIKYEHQLEIKKGIINNALKRIGGIDHEADELIGAENPFRYRNKMIFPVGEDKTGKTVCGFYRERSHDIIPLDDCFLGCEFNSKILAAVKEYMMECNVKAYDEKTHKGVIRRVFSRVGAVSGEIMIVISANSEKLSEKDVLIEKIRKKSENIVSIILNVNTKKTNLVLGEKNKVLFGKDTIKDILCGVEYEISPDMVDIRISAKEGFDIAMEDNNFIILNTELTKELIEEGIAREFISKIQNMRKVKEYNIVDRITIYYNGDEDVKETVNNQKEFIMNETLATDIVFKDSLEEKFDLNGHETYLDTEKNK